MTRFIRVLIVGVMLAGCVQGVKEDEIVGIHYIRSKLTEEIVDTIVYTEEDMDYIFDKVTEAFKLENDSLHILLGEWEWDTTLFKGDTIVPFDNSFDFLRPLPYG